MHQPYSFNSLDLSAPEEAYRKNIRASGTLEFGYEGVLKIIDNTNMLAENNTSFIYISIFYAEQIHTMLI